MKNKKIIMINGKKRAGKDFFADSIINKNFTKIAVAFKLKEIAYEIAGKEYDVMEEYKNNNVPFEIDIEDFDIKFRKALIKHYRYAKYDDNNIIEFIESFNVRSLPIFVDGYEKVDARLFLQHMNIFKNIFFNDNIWIDYTVDLIKSTKGNIVISDFRFPYEYEALSDNFTKVITAKVIGKNYYDVDEYDNHSSETSLNDFEFDYHINNTIWNEELLELQASLLIQELKGK